jgi:signal transduction histidine kinase
MAMVEEDCLKTCLEILLSNAVEAMSNGQDPTIEISLTREGSDIVVRVSDSGCGIASGDRERIFERDVTTKGPGHGLGLFHARQALAKFDASVRVESSALNEGTTMAIRLRVSESNGQEGEKEPTLGTMAQ